MSWIKNFEEKGHTIQLFHTKRQTPEVKTTRILPQRFPHQRKSHTRLGYTMTILG